MKNSEIQKFSTEELKTKLDSVRAEYNKLRLSHKVSPIENPIQLRDLRRTIARLETARNNKK